MCRYHRFATLLVAGWLMNANAANTDPTTPGAWLTLSQSQGEQTQTQRMVITQDAATLLSATGEPTAIYRKNTDELWLLDAAAGEAQRIDRAGAQTLAALLQQQLNQLEAELAALPPEQAELSRLRMRQLFDRGTGGAPFLTPDKVIDTGVKGSQAGISCDEFRLEASGANVGTACVERHGSIPYGDSLSGMLSLVADIHAALRSVDPGYINMILPGAPLLTLPAELGIPIAVTLRNEEGVELRTLTVSAIEIAPVPNALSEVPDNLRRLELADVVTPNR